MFLWRPSLLISLLKRLLEHWKTIKYSYFFNLLTINIISFSLGGWIKKSNSPHMAPKPSFAHCHWFSLLYYINITYLWSNLSANWGLLFLANKVLLFCMKIDHFPVRLRHVAGTLKRLSPARPWDGATRQSAAPSEGSVALATNPRGPGACPRWRGAVPQAAK